MAQASTKELHSSFGTLQISQPSRPEPKVKKSDVAESWEDEADQEDSSDAERELTPVQSEYLPAPPPPTPSSPYRAVSPVGHYESPNSSGATSPLRRHGDDMRRPEKSTAMVSRMIAAGIGQKAPKRTKEQREYDQAMKAQEKKKRDQAKEEEARKKQDKERALKDIWED